MGKRKKRSSSRFLSFLVREYLTSLYIYGRSDRRNSLRQEGKAFYATRPMHGLWFWEFSTNSVRYGIYPTWVLHFI